MRKDKEKVISVIPASPEGHGCHGDCLYSSTPALFEENGSVRKCQLCLVGPVNVHFDDADSPALTWIPVSSVWHRRLISSFSADANSSVFMPLLLKNQDLRSHPTRARVAGVFRTEATS